MSKTITIYDPPSGWRYGFPREYEPLLGETIEQTLLRDGYPQSEIDAGMAQYVRFWEKSLCPHEWSGWHYHHNGGGEFENSWRECIVCGLIEKKYRGGNNG